MSVGKVLEFGFSLIRNEPKIVLPAVLNWLPHVLLLILSFQFFTSIKEILNLYTLEQLSKDTNLIWKILPSILPYILATIPVAIISLFIYLLLMCIYSDIIRQAYTHKNISLVRAFLIAKLWFLSILRTYLIGFAILLGIGAIIILIIGGLSIWILSKGIVYSVFWMIFCIFIGIASVMVILTLFYEIPAVVVVENKSGLEAILRSLNIGKRNFWQLLSVILVAIFFTIFIKNTLSYVPYVGTLLDNLAGLILTAWNLMIPAVFYYEYEKKDFSRSF